MIALKGFESYDFCPRKCEVFSVKGILKSYYDKNQKYWILYRGEEKIKVTLSKILIENREKIYEILIQKMTTYELNFD